MTNGLKRGIIVTRSTDLGGATNRYPRPLSTVALGRATKHRHDRQSRHLWNKTTREVQFYLSSLPCNAVESARAIRAHWGIENQLNWVLDVTNGYGCVSHSY